MTSSISQNYNEFVCPYTHYTFIDPVECPNHHVFDKQYIRLNNKLSNDFMSTIPCPTCNENCGYLHQLQPRKDILTKVLEYVIKLNCLIHKLHIIMLVDDIMNYINR